MLDLSFFREHLEETKSRLLLRGVNPKAIEGLAKTDASHRKLIQKVETLRAKRKVLSKQIGQAKAKGEDPQEVMVQVKEMGNQVNQLTEELRATAESLRSQRLSLPNFPDSSVPPGEDENSNREEKRWGDPPVFSFKPKPHHILGEALGIMDFGRAAKVSGSRFVFLKGAGSALERALISMMLQIHTQDHGYEELSPPYLVGAQALEGTAQLPKFAEDLFKVEGQDRYLIPTAEVPLTNYHSQEVLLESQLPKRYVAYTPCFRSEAGSYGKDTVGMIRHHQFDKVELVQITRPKESWEAHEALTSHAEAILERLELPYRRVSLCVGDLGFAATKTYDLEVWLPSQGTYREISSCSHFLDFQARRAGIRFKAPAGKPAYCHTLNGSGLAVGRTLVALLENFQQEDGSVCIPDGLRPFFAHSCIKS